MHLNKERSRWQYRAYCGVGGKGYNYSSSAHRALMNFVFSSKKLRDEIECRVKERVRKKKERLGRYLTKGEMVRERILAVKDVARKFLDRVWRASRQSLLAAQKCSLKQHPDPLGIAACVCSSHPLRPSQHTKGMEVHVDGCQREGSTGSAGGVVKQAGKAKGR